MRSFKDYNFENKNVEGKDNDDILEIINRYTSTFNGRNSNDIMNKIISEATKSKQEGKLTNEQIDMFCNQFAPMLNIIQRKKLYSIAEKLKKI